MARRLIDSRMTVTTHSGEIVEHIAAARANRTALRIHGAGTWLDAGHPCSASSAVYAGSGIVTYEPGDLTLTARAGTSLAEIERVTGEHGQWMTLDPHGADTGTLGATVATSSWGPLANAFGTPRDHVLGCEFVTGAGDVVNAGGRVVKNVAGFDLVRLATGAWGTVGVLTEITVRLRARPEVDRTLAIPVSSADAAARWLRGSVHTPLAAELLSPSLSKQITGGAETCLLVRLGGNEPLVNGASATTATLGHTRSVSTSVWRDFASAEPASAIVFRLSTTPARIALLWERAVELTELFDGFAHGTLGRGVVRCILPPCTGADAERLHAMLAAHAADTTIVGERLPASLWPIIARRRSTDMLAHQVRRAFDPDGILNPGILGTE
jgi:glycolate oxidase FAD binding subunit